MSDVKTNILMAVLVTKDDLKCKNHHGCSTVFLSTSL